MSSYRLTELNTSSSYQKLSIRYIIKNAVNVLRGRRIWRKIRKENGICEDREKVILFPDNDHELNYAGLLYLASYLKTQKDTFRKNKINIISSDRILLKSSVFFNHYCKPIYLDNDKISLLLKYVSVFPTYRPLIIISLREPFGRKCDNLVGADDITIDDLVAIGIYRIRVADLGLLGKPIDPIYYGNDDEVISYLEKRNAEQD